MGEVSTAKADVPSINFPNLANVTPGTYSFTITATLDSDPSFSCFYTLELTVQSHTTISFDDASTVREFIKTTTDVDDKIELELPTATAGEVDLGSVYKYNVTRTSADEGIEPLFDRETGDAADNKNMINTNLQPTPRLWLYGMHGVTAGTTFVFNVRCAIISEI